MLATQCIIMEMVPDLAAGRPAQADAKLKNGQKVRVCQVCDRGDACMHCRGVELLHDVPAQPWNPQLEELAPEAVNG